MGIEVAAHIIYHLLAYFDRCVVVQERNAPQNDVDHYEADSRQDEQDRGRKPVFNPPRDRFAAQNVVYYDLERPGFEEFAAADDENLSECYQERNPVGPQIFSDLFEHKRKLLLDPIEELGHATPAESIH
jgi:hypothetical protein